MAFRDYIPFTSSMPPSVEGAIGPVEEASPSKDLPIKARAIRSKGNFSLFWNNNSFKRQQFEEPEYDFKRISKAIDTDSYAKQAFYKYNDLFWKEGWEITGENSEAVGYIWSRIDALERMMGQSFGDFLSEVSDQLVKYSNVFVAIARTDIRSMLPRQYRSNISDEQAQNMIAGFYIIPTETVNIKRDKFNRPTAYAQVLKDSLQTTKDDKSQIVWRAEDVIHLYLDRKPGKAFGTPFFESVMDDIVSLRQIEEDILNLGHRELFPMYLYKVGTPEYPSKEGEIDEAVNAIENLKEDGGLVAPFHHNIEVIGAGGVSLDFANYLAHFKERVAIGLGVSPHHLGMMEGTSNRSVTERLDLALYDKIKNLQTYFENSLRINVFNPLLEEGGFSPSGAASTSNTSDVCYFEFNEIDIDTEVKKINHYIDMFMKNAITWEELRTKIKMDLQVDSDNLFMIMQAKIQAHLTAQTQAVAAASSTGTTTSKPDAVKPATKGQVNLPNIGKGPANKNRPANQHGRNQSPGIKNQMDRAEIFAEKIKELIEENDE